MMKTGIDLGIATVGIVAGTASGHDWPGIFTAASAGIYLICKGIVLVIREYRKKQK